MDFPIYFEGTLSVKLCSTGVYLKLITLAVYRHEIAIEAG